VFIPGIPLRLIGRISFPIFCFLLAEGAYHTRHPGKYALRLLVGALLAELPFDFCFYGGVDWWHQSVMVTLLLGYGALLSVKQVDKLWLKIISGVPFVVLAYFLGCDYGEHGVLLMLLFGLTRELPGKRVLQTAGMLFLFWTMNSRVLFMALGTSFTLQLMGVLSMIPIALYSGEKRTHSKLVQWGFYLFYPVHLAVFALLK